MMSAGFGPVELLGDSFTVLYWAQVCALLSDPDARGPVDRADPQLLTRVVASAAAKSVARVYADCRTAGFWPLHGSVGGP